MTNRNPCALEAKRTPQQIIPGKRHQKRSKAQRRRDAIEQDNRSE